MFSYFRKVNAKPWVQFCGLALWSLNVPFILYKKNAKDVNNNVSIRGECDIAISLYYTTNLPTEAIPPGGGNIW